MTVNDLTVEELESLLKHRKVCEAVKEEVQRSIQKRADRGFLDILVGAVVRDVREGKEKQ
jgi:hypothetical protein